MFQLTSFVLKNIVPRIQPQIRQMGRLNNRSIAPFWREINRRKKVVELDHMLKRGKVPIDRRSSYSDWNYQAEVTAFQVRLGEKFEMKYLLRAFVTESHVNSEVQKQKELGVEVSTGLIDNSELAREGSHTIQRTLEGWFRAVLPSVPEEGVNQIVSYLTSKEMMAEISFHLGIRELVLSEEYPPSAETLKSSLQAVVGALFKSNPESAEKFVIDIIASQIAGRDINEIISIQDPMGTLTSILSRSGLPAPESRLLFQSGPTSVISNHMVGIYCDKNLIGQSFGEALDIAEEMAARDALRNIFKTSESVSPFPFGEKYQVNDKPNSSLTDYSFDPQNLVQC